MKRPTGALIPPLEGLSDAPRGSLHRQIYERVRTAILDGTLSPGQRLPSSRSLAQDLRVSRITVETALTQLRAEGFLVRRIGSGSYVADAIPEPDQLPRAARRRAAARSRAPARPRGATALSARGRALVAAAPGPEPTAARAFVPCMPDLEAFPLATWRRLMARHTRRAGGALLGYGTPAGHRPLREAIAAHLSSARGVRCTWEQVIVLTSAQQGLELVARVLIDPGDDVWMEDPGYLGARAAFRGTEARIVPVPVDEAGLVVDAGIAAAPDARLAYVTPSHQYPTGGTMTLPRRLALLAWAEHAGAWVLEDDYDSEFRYATRPIAALQGLDRSDRVLYVGSFNKVLFPSLRLAYLVVPPDLLESVAAVRALMDGHSPLLPQAALADFIAEGHFAAHIRRMRELYRERRDALLSALATTLPSALRLGPCDAGMHVTAWLPHATEDRAIVEAGAAAGLELRALSPHYATKRRRPGLVLGYSASPPAEIRRGVTTLARILASTTGRGMARTGP